MQCVSWPFLGQAEEKEWGPKLAAGHKESCCSRSNCPKVRVPSQRAAVQDLLENEGFLGVTCP